ncbi:MAG: hypothetical protein HN729_12800 [Candidatus Marinimicrobia bacterium]|jgi:hypothetical protein|nr:hypothetical protein [Candidatus Neomarinimicrobiota bacterium]MBT3634644.1 hypothetical protein [Candidatus Neomarinimicrobiota bacterium]MBT3682726.1 hypothetical protein [Candidatus Neomarinimicrobiota bacterium]MBT3759619.1 hypothetical protein [Candidatus Neomarinimicrobiota bacterium]MBT3894509.1 hypothetical protein [Candidatus Neomarinimicrobiota bacterium]
MQKLRYIVLLIIIIIVPGVNTLMGDDNCNICHNSQEPNLQPINRDIGFHPKAVGVMDKGQLQNNTSNFGDFSDFHAFFTNAAHWPRSAPYERQYAFGVGLVIGIDSSNVIETVTQTSAIVQDWLPPANAIGKFLSGEITGSDGTPFQATSDFRETWPFGYYDDNNDWVSTPEDRQWPGFYRVNVMHEDFPNTIVEIEDEFTSDRDVFSTYNDSNNPFGSHGIVVEQSGYSYGRPYAEDFIFWELNVSNTGDTDLEDIYIGYYAKLRPDYDNHDYLNFIDTDNDGQKDFVYVYDINNQNNGVWADTPDPLGIVGIRVFDTPGQIGINNFHHFGREVSPNNDEKFWALMTSNIDANVLADSSLGLFFHGDDTNIDSTSPDSLISWYPPTNFQEIGADLEGDAVNFLISTGPFTLPADSSVLISLGMIMGDAGTIPSQPDTTDLMQNVRMANDMYDLYFQGSAAPQPPIVNAVASDHSATIFWTDYPSEQSIDILTGKMDFEGYKVFRSSDKGLTWGEPITNVYGDVVSWVPMAIYDYTLDEDLSLYGKDISGLDPVFPQHLGVNSGLAHTFRDTNLVNGLEYWYCVSAFDTGNQHPDSLEQSYLYPLGASTIESHTVSVIPGVKANNIIDPNTPLGNLQPDAGLCDGIIYVDLLEPENITGHDYKITFTDDVIYEIEENDTTFGMGFSLIDTTDWDTLFFDHPLSNGSGDNLPVTDGFRLTVQNSPTGIRSFGWTQELDTTSCTFDWRYESIDPSAGNQLIQGEIATFDDWRITVDYLEGDSLIWFDMFSGELQDEKQHVPLKIEVITDPDNPIDVTNQSWLGEFALGAPDFYRQMYYSLPGWDLEPGGKGYTHGSPGWYEKHVDVIILEKIDIEPSSGDTIPNYLYLFTNNKPDISLFYNPETNSNDTLFIDAKAPSQGDEFTIRTFKPFRPGITTYTFNTTALQVLSTNELDEDPFANLRVVPDPYIVTNAWETGEFGKKLQFNHLPDKCTIKIYTLNGEPIATINHDSLTGYEFWDMRTYNDQFIAPGVYLYHAYTTDGDKALGRFLVIK